MNGTKITKNQITNCLPSSKVMIAALAMTLINYWALTRDSFLYMLLVSISAAFTFVLYYMDGCVATFVRVSLSIASALVRLLGLFLGTFGFLMGIGLLLGALILIWLIPATLIVAVYIAYLLPVVVIPVLHIAAMFLKIEIRPVRYGVPDDRAAQAWDDEPRMLDTQASDVDWEGVYGRVMETVGSDTNESER